MGIYNVFRLKSNQRSRKRAWTIRTFFVIAFAAIVAVCVLMFVFFISKTSIAWMFLVVAGYTFYLAFTAYRDFTKIIKYYDETITDLEARINA